MTRTKLTPVCRDAARADAICNHVMTTPASIMEPYEQGAWTWCAGMPRSDNPYIKGHPAWPEWHRGWDEEASAHENKPA
jgi:hypothetical protein